MSVWPRLWFFQWSCMDVRVGLWRKLSTGNWCFWTVVLEQTLESPLDCKEIQPVHAKGDQSWVFIGRTDAEAEIPILWPPHEKGWLIGNDPGSQRVRHDWATELNWRNLYSEKHNAKLFTLLSEVSETVRKIKYYNNKMTFACPLLFSVFNLLDI